jgi:hypothetical protein
MLVGLLHPQCSSAASLPNARRPRASLPDRFACRRRQAAPPFTTPRANPSGAPAGRRWGDAGLFLPLLPVSSPTFYRGRRQGAQGQLPRCGAESAAAGCRGRRPHPPAMVSNCSDPLSFSTSKTSISSRSCRNHALGFRAEGQLPGHRPRSTSPWSWWYLLLPPSLICSVYSTDEKGTHLPLHLVHVLGCGPCNSNLICLRLHFRTPFTRGPSLEQCLSRSCCRPPRRQPSDVAGEATGRAPAAELPSSRATRSSHSLKNPPGWLITTDWCCCLLLRIPMSLHVWKHAVLCTTQFPKCLSSECCAARCCLGVS